MTHRSVRRYAPEPVDEALISELVACAQSAATSSNLQLWSMVSVQEPERRARMAALCADQRHVLEAPWFFAFLVDHHRLREAAQAAGRDPAGLETTEFFVMACIDVALAAERMVCAAESVGLGICYIGALRNHPEDVARLLEMPPGTFGAFGLCIGWPDPAGGARIKPRLRQDALWFRERYECAVDVAEYDARMSRFYEEEGMKGEVTWSMRSGRRADGSPRSMTGREVLKSWLDGRGFART